MDVNLGNFCRNFVTDSAGSSA